jgi:hypothetical protein
MVNIAVAMIRRRRVPCHPTASTQSSTAQFGSARTRHRRPRTAVYVAASYLLLPWVSLWWREALASWP